MPANQNIKVAVDAVVFGYDAARGLQLLLIRRNVMPFKDQWALPGGLVHDDESLEDAVHRELQEETGISISYLEQLYSFGKPGRDPRNRVISITYYGLVKPGGQQLSASTDAAEARWFPFDALPALAFDHAEIIDVARERLRGKITYEPIGFELLDEKFPFSDLEKLYQTVIGRSIDRRNFKKKIMKYGFLEETTERQQLKGAGRRGFLYQFNEEKYFELVREGINIEI